MGVVPREYRKGNKVMHGYAMEDFEVDEVRELEAKDVDEVVHLQEQEVHEATARLNLLEARWKEGYGDNIDDLCREVGGGPNTRPAKLSFDQILRLLLGSMEGKYVKSIPKQKCASPVSINTATQSYFPSFYVSKEKKLAKQEDYFEGIPVRYQGFTKATVWFSPEHPRWGIVARRMQHQARMKQKTACDRNMASKAALFFHVFEGFSYVLIDRKDHTKELTKAELGAYVVESAAKFVQIAPVFRPSEGCEARCVRQSISPRNSRIKLEPRKATQGHELMGKRRRHFFETDGYVSSSSSDSSASLDSEWTMQHSSRKQQRFAREQATAYSQFEEESKTPTCFEETQLLQLPPINTDPIAATTTYSPIVTESYDANQANVLIEDPFDFIVFDEGMDFAPHVGDEDECLDFLMDANLFANENYSNGEEASSFNNFH